MTRAELLNLTWVTILCVAVILMVADPHRFFQVAAFLVVVLFGPIAGAGLIFSAVRCINRQSGLRHAKRHPDAP